ncbi:MAG: tetratricopeptide repeat protein [Deltaproteobacteria bacterium]|nr:tetratricopeptide repeat protein [Deltaproteobacteria bacterium]
MSAPHVDEVEGLDDEFLFHLNRGAELLARGEAPAARASLGRALELRPRDSQALGLLGQAEYKMGRFEDAAHAYSRLVDENPVEPSARVNLGLANLKAKRYVEAVKQLSVALDLQPTHRKAMGYLGLAHLEAGEFEKARDWFAQAGSEQMVARCKELLALSQAAAAKAAEAPLRATPPPGSLPLLPTPPPGPNPLHATPALGYPPQAAEPPLGASTLSQLAESRLLVPAAVEVFAAGRGLLTVAVHGDVLVRGKGLVAVRGSVRLSPEMKRFRGKATDKPFGDGAERMMRAAGEGALLFRTGELRLTAVDLAGESGYFREEAIFGFEDALAYENGRVASRLGIDLNLVHLRGRGRFLLATTGELAALPVSADAPLRVPLPVLAGWMGTVTPRVAPLAEGADPADPSASLVVELSGDGRVFLDPEAAPGTRARTERA